MRVMPRWLRQQSIAPSKHAARRIRHEVFLPKLLRRWSFLRTPARSCLDDKALVQLTCYYAGPDTQGSLCVSPHPAAPGTRRHRAARAGGDPRRDRAARPAARHRDRQGGALRAARRLALPGVGSARAPRGGRIGGNPAPARHACRAHRSRRLPPGDVHPPRAGDRSRARGCAARRRGAARRARPQPA